MKRQISSRKTSEGGLLQFDAPHEQEAVRPAHASRGFTQDFSRVRVSAFPAGTLQARLAIGHTGDPFEREADRVADSVMRSRVAGEPSASSFSPSVDGAESLRRATAEDEAAPAGDRAIAPADAETGTAEDVAAMLLESDDLEDSGDAPAAASPATDEGTVQARELAGATPTLPPRLAAGIDALRGQGQPLPSSSRAFFEPRFGRDLSQVRVHTSADASHMATGVHARAFTVGRDVVFGEHQFQPETSRGRWLIAHELAHVVQQQEGSSRSAAGQQVHPVGRRLQGGFFGDVWSGIKKGASAVASGIKKGASAVWGGIKKGASAAWGGVKWAAGKVWAGAKAVAGWSWNVLKSGAALAWSQIVKTPERIWRLIKHLGQGIAGVASWMWEGLKLAWHLDFKGLGKWFVNGLVSGAAWVGRLLAKLVDIAGIGEVWDLLSQIIKFNTRTLTSVEKTEAQKTFKSSISYWQVRIDELSLIARIGAAFGPADSELGVTTFHTINFSRGITAAPGSGDMHWLTHELTHVSQYEHAGTQYLGEALHAQFTEGYDYLGPARPLWRPATNASPNPSGKHFSQYNREQQGNIAADYYYSLYGLTPKPESLGPFTPIRSDYEPVIDELRAGNL